MRFACGSAALILITAFLSACGGPATTMTSTPEISMLDSLSVGMPIREVRNVFGPPIRVTSMAFGQQTGQAWSGLVAEYDGRKDGRFKYNKRFRKTRLVFAFVASDTLLNSWYFDDAGALLR